MTEDNLYSRIATTIESSSIDTDNYYISYDYLDSSGSGDIDRTIADEINVVVEIKNKTTGSSIKQPMTVLNFPKLTPQGCKISGVYYSPLSIDKRASGWYINRKAISGKKELLLELVPDKGMKVRAKNNYGEIAVMLGSNSMIKINIGCFLQALTGKSLKEIGFRLGKRNQFVASSLVEEVSRDVCIDRVLRALMRDYKDISGEFKFKELKRRFFNKQYMDCSSSRARTLEKTLFSNRALYKELASEIRFRLDGVERIVKKGTQLDLKTLRDIDESTIDTLLVYHESKIYELKKYKIPDDKSFSDEELFTMFNMFACALAGYPTEDKAYELDNRRILTFDDTIITLVENRLSEVSRSVSDMFLTKGEFVDVTQLSVPKHDPSKFMNDLKSKNRQGEIAETTNWLSVKAKQNKVISDFTGRGSSEMTAVKDTETGFYDSYVQPEGENIGLVHQPTLTAVAANNGVLHTPCVKMKDGQALRYEEDEDGHSIGEVIVDYLSPSQRTSSLVAPWDENCSKDEVRCYYKGRIIEVSRDKVEYQEYSTLNNLSLMTAIIPFPENSSGKRITMGGSHSKQAQLTLKTSRNLVSTGVASLYVSKDLITAKTILEEAYVINSSKFTDFISIEEFKEREIKLVSTDMTTSGYRKLIFKVLGDDIPRFNGTISKTISYCERTTTNSVTQMNIKSAPDFIYRGDDLVAYPNSLDVKKYNLEKHINLGYHTESIESEEIFDVDLALGNSYLVGYKTYSSLVMDDSIIISSELLGSNMTARIILQDVSHKLRIDQNSREDFGCLEDDPRFEKNGLPVIGTVIKPKEKVIYKYSIADGVRRSTPKRVNSTTEGVVVDAKIVGLTAVVTLASYQEIGVGDKMTGDHGNKCVIGKVVPQSNMPFTKEGKSIQILLNPLGLPSRMNAHSQLKECLLGYAMVKRSEAEGRPCAIVISPQNPKSTEIAQTIIDEYKIGPEYLFDGRNGKRFPRKTTIGYLYMKILYHTADSMFNSTGITANLNPSTLQPVRGKKREGGQSEGEMETWALAGSNAFRILQEHMSIQSDDVKNKKKLENYMKDPDNVSLDDIVNHNDDYLLACTRSLGCNISNDENSDYELEYMTDKDICSLASRPIKCTKEALDDSEIFGYTRTALQTADARSRWGYLDLKCEIINPNWIYKSKLPNLIIVTKLIPDDSEGYKEVVTWLSPKALEEVIYGKAFIADYNSVVYYTKVKSLLNADWCDGMPAVITCFKSSTFSNTKDFYNEILQNNDKKETDRFNASEMLSRVQSFERRGLDLKDLPTSHFPIMPKPFRLSSKDRSADADYYYASIISIINNQTEYKERATMVFRKLSGFIGVNRDEELPADKCVKTLKDTFSAKEGFRANSLSKTLLMSSRSVIVPAEAGTIKLGEVGFPFKAAVEKYGGFIRPILEKRFPILEERSSSSDTEFMDDFMVSLVNQDISIIASSLDVDYETGEELYKEIRYIITDFCLTRAENVGRQPTLHRYGMRTLIPRICYDKAMHIHPLLGPGYNCDYDGDQMHAEALLTRLAVLEGLSHMSPACDLLNPKDGSFILEPFQDILLGCYIATMLHNNCLTIDECFITNREGNKINPYSSEEHVTIFRDLDLMLSSVENGEIEYQDLVSYKHSNGRWYLSTAGRILFNSTFFDGFTEEEFSNPLKLNFIKTKGFYSDLKFDGLIRKKAEDYNSVYNSVKNGTFEGLVCYKMSDVSKFLCRDLSTCSDSLIEGWKICQQIDRIFIYGVNACDKSGITLALPDFIEHPGVDKYINYAREIMKKVTRTNDLGLMTDEDRVNTSFKVYDYITTKVERSLLSYYPRNNNLFIIMDSGARGNVSQLMQTCGIIGTVKKNSKEMLETPILSNYSRGLSSSDQNSIAFGTRDGFATVQQDTAKAGELTRASVYTLANFKIVEHDCKSEYKEFKVEHSDSVLSCSFIDNDGKSTPISITDVLYKPLSVDDENYEKLLSIGGDTITSNSLYFIKKNSVSSVVLSNGTVNIKYRLSSVFRDLMMFRVAENLPYLQGGLITGDGRQTGSITSKTLEHIENSGLKSINVRTMLTCNSVGGVCAKCYGLKMGTLKYPKVGEMIGVTAAQSLGESAVQCQMDQLNSGGKGSSLGAVEVFKQYCRGSVPSAGDKAEISPISGYVSVRDVGKTECTIHFDAFNAIKVKKSLLLVKDGEFINRGDTLSEGLIEANRIFRDNLEDTIRSRQIALLHVFSGLFSGGGVYISMRNFEALVRAQTSLARVYSSEDPDIPSGSIAFLSEVNKSKFPLKYFTKVEHSDVVINKFGGFLTNFSHSRMFETLANSTLTPWMKMTKSSSFIGQLAVGENTATGERKLIHQPSHSNIDTVDRGVMEASKTFRQSLGDFIVSEKKESTVDSSLEEDLFNLDELIGDNTTTTSLNPSNSFSKESKDFDIDLEFDELSEVENKDISPNSSNEKTHNTLSESSRFK